MNVIDALNSHRTVRTFGPDPLKSGIILKILDATTRAFSSGNSRPWELFVAGGDALNRLVNVMKSASGQLKLSAPTILVRDFASFCRTDFFDIPCDNVEEKLAIHHAKLALPRMESLQSISMMALLSMTKTRRSLAYP